MAQRKWEIRDWAGNLKFNGKLFDSVQEASDFLIESLDVSDELDDEAFAEELNEFDFWPVN